MTAAKREGAKYIGLFLTWATCVVAALAVSAIALAAAHERPLPSIVALSSMIAVWVWGGYSLFRRYRAHCPGCGQRSARLDREGEAGVLLLVCERCGHREDTGFRTSGP